MTLYTDENAIRDHAGLVASKATKKKSRKIWALSAAGVLVAGGGAAWAAMAVSSNEASATVTAGQAQQLGLDDAVASGALYPGMSVDVSFKVSNPNPFPVTLTSIVAGSGSPSVTCATPSDVQYLSSSLLVSGSSLTLPSAVTIDPSGSKTITVPKAVKLGSAASGGCTITGKFKVSGTGAGTDN